MSKLNYQRVRDAEKTERNRQISGSWTNSDVPPAPKVAEMKDLLRRLQEIRVAFGLEKGKIWHKGDRVRLYLKDGSYYWVNRHRKYVEG